MCDMGFCAMLDLIVFALLCHFASQQFSPKSKPQVVSPFANMRMEMLHDYHRVTPSAGSRLSQSSSKMSQPGSPSAGHRRPQSAQGLRGLSVASSTPTLPRPSPTSALQSSGFHSASLEVAVSLTEKLEQLKAVNGPAIARQDVLRQHMDWLGNEVPSIRMPLESLREGYKQEFQFLTDRVAQLSAHTQFLSQQLGEDAVSC